MFSDRRFEFQVRPISARSSVYDVENITPECMKKGWGKTDPLTLAFIYGVHSLDRPNANAKADQSIIESIDQYFQAIKDPALRVKKQFFHAIVLTTSFSDAYEVWSSPTEHSMQGEVSREIPRPFQDKITAWLIKGVKENPIDAFVDAVITAMSRIESRDSVLDDQDYFRLRGSIGADGMKRKVLREDIMFKQLNAILSKSNF